MYGRATRVQMPPQAIEKGIATFKEKVVPAAKAQPGNLGLVLLVDRKTGAAIGITLWESAQALGAAEMGPLPASAIQDLENLRRTHPAFRS